MTFGGKALNVAIGVSRLGGSPYATGLMYNENGYMFERELDKEGVPFRFIWNKGRARENYKFIDNRAMLTEVNDVGEEVSKEKTAEVQAFSDSGPAKAQALICLFSTRVSTSRQLKEMPWLRPYVKSFILPIIILKAKASD